MATKPNDDNSLSHTRWNCKYHIVFIPKYRRKEIYGKIREYIRNQELEDMKEDKLTSKEYEDPFKGAQKK